ncbi:hypothetical protein Pelo_9756 [Pelomyxa schiedti]|nr:hypothetical protein Pelo_9756 [Pelomyxa schiedti]
MRRGAGPPEEAQARRAVCPAGRLGLRIKIMGLGLGTRVGHMLRGLTTTVACLVPTFPLLRVVVQMMQQVPECRDCVNILVGDMNTIKTREAVCSFLCTEGFGDTWTEAQRREDNGCKFSTFRGWRPNLAPSSRQAHDGSQFIDWVVYRDPPVSANDEDSSTSTSTSASTSSNKTATSASTPKVDSVSASASSSIRTNNRNRNSNLLQVTIDEAKYWTENIYFFKTTTEGLCKTEKSYQALTAGTLGESLRDLTGAPCITYNFKLLSRLQQENLWWPINTPHVRKHKPKKILQMLNKYKAEKGFVKSAATITSPQNTIRDDFPKKGITEVRETCDVTLRNLQLATAIAMDPLIERTTPLTKNKRLSCYSHGMTVIHATCARDMLFVQKHGLKRCLAVKYLASLGLNKRREHDEGVEEEEDPAPTPFRIPLPGSETKTTPVTQKEYTHYLGYNSIWVQYPPVLFQSQVSSEAISSNF